MIKKQLSISGCVRLAEKYWWVLAILAVVMTYIIIMLLSLGQNVWFDEGYSITLAKQSVSRLLSLTAVDAHPPVYYLLLKLWGSTFGWSEFALRSLSAIAASATVGAMLVLVRHLFTKRVAVLVIPFLVLSPFFLRYGYEIRMYALVGLIGVLATMSMVNAVQSGKKKWWILYAVLVAIGMYTLYVSVVIWLAHLVWLIAKSIKQKQSILKQPWIKSYTFAVILFLPYISTFIYQITHSALPGIGNTLNINGLSGVLSMLMDYLPSWQIGGLLSIVLLIIVGLGIYLAIYVIRKMPGSNKQWFLLILSCFFVPLIFYILVSLLPKPFFIPRYIAHVALFFYVIIGIITALGWRYGKRVLVVILGGLSGILLIVGVFQLLSTGNFNFERLQKPSASSVRATVICNNSTVIVADDPYIYIDSSYYFDGCNLRFYSKDNVAFEGGYAPLHDSALRVSSASSIRAQTLYVLHWIDGAKYFTPTTNYHLTSTATFDKQTVDRYELNH